ncbi:MAG TPA: DUF3175 domain-containing protein [Puia sp.]
MATKKKWSGEVTKNSNALDLDKGIFTSGSPGKIARSLEHSAETSKRKKGSAYQSAMSMLSFYINRAGKNLPAKKKQTLEKAKDLLKELHGKDKEKKTSAQKSSRTSPKKGSRTSPKKSNRTKTGTK